MQYCILLTVLLAYLQIALSDIQKNDINKNKCNIPPEAPKKVEEIINVCQDEIKLQILQEALSAIQLTSKNIKEEELKRVKRSAWSNEDKRIAGCLLQCVYGKINALNEYGFPLAQGLVDFYTTGVEDKEYKIATNQAVHFCLNSAFKIHIKTAESLQEYGKTCDIAYEVFDCIAQEVGKYCGQTP